MSSADQQQRLQAIDTNMSCIVQAPAGSGKTELLIQRLLSLLAVVDKPQQILAITFTNKAAAEMRRRLLDALAQARTAPQPQAEHEALTWRLARQALERQGESLLLNPAQLAIQTIDSFCATIVRKMPWVTRFGGMPEMSDDASELYEAAVTQLLAQLEQPGPVSDALKIVLEHLDNDMAVVQRMLVSLLGRRDQWLRHLVNDKDQLHRELNAGLERICNEHLERARQSVPAPLVTELLACVDFAAHHCPDDSAIARWRGQDVLPPATVAHVSLWCGLADLLLTSSGTLRKSLNKNIGFPAGNHYQASKQRMINLLQQVERVPDLVDAFLQLRSLPQQLYSVKQWQLLDALFDLLPRLVAQLWLVFRSRGQADFSEIALKANQALGGADNPSELLLQLDYQLQHILVDEFQDTSRLQYQLFSTLTTGWTAGDGRTLFLVGDPMQSIYRFREAEVGLFLHSFKGSFGNADVPLIPLRLCCNFRSQQGIVDWVNQTFTTIFPARMDVTTGAVPVATAQAVKPALAGDAVHIHPFAAVDDVAEAERIVAIIEAAQAQDSQQTIAVLVRGRNHLQRLLPLLRQRNIDYQAKDIDRLEARPAVLDIVHLTRALLHRGDRLAWSAILRAPWCGLTLNDLHPLCEDPHERTIPSRLADMNVIARLSDDGRRRLERVWPILQRGMKVRSQLPLRDLVEGCWVALGGPVGLGENVMTDVNLVFTLLEELDQGGDLVDMEQLTRRLQQLYSPPDSRSSGNLQIMTIHKAKGLQFDTVILPGLGKKTRTSDAPLLRWLEHPEHGLLLAPVSARGSREKDLVYQLVAHLEANKNDFENARLLYVATTRAIRHLHLLGHAQSDQHGELQPASGSLLEKLWPQVSHAYQQLEPSTDMGMAEDQLVRLQRLKSSWKLPQTGVVPLVSLPAEKTASTPADESLVDNLYSGWEKSLHRHVGTLVHQIFERIIQAGSGVWNDVKEVQRIAEIQQSLRASGVRQKDLAEATQKVLEAVDRTLASSRGKWLLATYLDQAAELPLSGLKDEQLIHAVIDRTFVTDGLRWVVDYKTSTPAPGEKLEDFYQREGARYQPQLQIYAELMQRLDPDHPTKAALYFPLVDGWLEIDTAAG
ncbi:MAG: UvrD-helicase domain-containing protein [Pelovirga sp.]